MAPRPSSVWLRAGSLGMAGLAVLALVVTVAVAMRALHDASETVVRGESEALLDSVTRDYLEEGTPDDLRAFLTRELEAHADAGLRYAAVLERDSLLAEVGGAQMSRRWPRDGESIVEGDRARIGGTLLRSRRGPRAMPAGRGRLGPAVLVLEHELPVVRQLSADLTRLSVVAGVACVVLLGFAAAWSRSVRRLEVLAKKAAHEQRLVALGGMASVMAHELRNPLAALKGQTQLLVEDLEGKDSKDHARAERIVAQAERLEGLTRSLLDFVRDGPIERAPAETRTVVDHALHALDAQRVDVSLAADAETVYVDAIRMARALHNLLDNALQADETGRIELDVRTERGMVVFAVRDHGPGIAADTKLFEPFATTRVKGTGLGLSVVLRIAEQHGGTADGVNHPEGGALFTIRIPRQGEPA